MGADMCNTLVVAIGTLEKLEPKMDCLLLQDLYIPPPTSITV